MAEVIGASSQLVAKYLAVRQGKGGGLTRPWKGDVVEAASPWTGVTPKGDLYAGDAVNLYAKDLCTVPSRRLIRESRHQTCALPLERHGHVHR